MTDYTDDQLRRAHLDAAVAQWRQRVSSEEHPEIVTRYFNDTGWGWALAQAGVEQYSEWARRQNPGLLEWCGLFLAYCGLRVGEHLEDGQCVPVRLRWDIATELLPSTYRIQSDDRREDIDDPPGILRPDDVALRAGDIITLETTRGLYYGDHFAMVESVDGDQLHTVEGNAIGQLGDGERGRGVIRRERDIDDVRRVYRLTNEHYEQVSA